jgi:hypothetical protein
MKVAFCLSGQLRTWKKCHTSWARLFERFKEEMWINDIWQHPPYANEPFEIDYFIHTWDFNTPPHYTWDINWNEPNLFTDVEIAEKLKLFDNSYTSVDKSEIEEVIHILNPKDYIVEGWDVSKSRTKAMDDITRSHSFDRNHTQSHISWSASQLYSILRAAHLKQKYEIENKIEYDLCIRSRFDLNFDDNNLMLFARDFEKPKSKTIYSVHNGSLNQYPFNLIGDIFYYSDSHTFDLLTSMYDIVPHIEQSAFKKSIKIEEVMTYIVRMFQLNNVFIDSEPNVIRD